MAQFPPFFPARLPSEHGRGLSRGNPFAPAKAAPIVTPKGPPPPRPQPYGGMFSGSFFEQAQKIADYLFGPYKQQYEQQRAQQGTLDTQRLQQLQAYIQQVAQSLTGLAPQVLDIYRTAASDNSIYAKGFSDMVSGAIQSSADLDNQILSQIDAPSGQMIPESQATQVGDVVYGLGGWIPATLLSAQGARAAAEAARWPAIVQQRGVQAVSDLLGQQQEASSELDAAYQQALAGRPQAVMEILGNLQAGRAAKQEAAAKARGAAAEAVQKQAEALTKTTNYLYVVTKNGRVKRATGRNGKPVYVGDLETQYDKASGFTTAINPQTGEIVWRRRTGTPQPDAADKLITHFDPNSGMTTAVNPRTGKIVWRQRTAVPDPVEPPKLVTHYDPQSGMTTAVDPETGKVVWRQRTGSPKQPSPSRPLVVGSSSAGWTIYDPDTGEVIGEKPPGTTKPKLVTHYDPQTGLTTAVDSQTGKVVWRQRTGSPAPAAAQQAPQPKLYESGAAWVPTKDGGWKYVPPPPPPPEPGKPKKRQVLDPDTGLPLSGADIDDAHVAIRTLIHPKPGSTNPIGSVIAEAERIGIPPSIWVPIVMNQYRIPRQFKDLRHMGVPRLHNIAVFLGYQPDPARPLDKRGLISWITQHLPKGEAAAEPAAADAKAQALRAPGGQYVPLPTALPPGSEFASVDAEGAPDASGVGHHAAKDWFAPAGTTVAAPVPGTVIEVKQATDHSGQVYGGVVKVQGANGRVWVFRHVDPANIRVGDRVKGGQQIATVSRWDDAPSKTHAHIELWKTREGGYRYENMIDPLTVFAPGTFPEPSLPATTKPQQSNDVKLATKPAGARQVAKRMAALRGWTGKQWRDLNVLIQSESGWNYRAWHNPSTGRADIWKGQSPPPHGAFGIGQALGHELPPDYATNPVVQIQWMLDYIAQRYKTPSAALQFKIDHGGLRGGLY